MGNKGKGKGKGKSVSQEDWTVPALPGLWALERRSRVPEGDGRHGPAFQAEATAACARGAFRRLRRWWRRRTRSSPLRTAVIELGRRATPLDAFDRAT
eukprot:7214550-Heterocapsa_arctica.AAC.1